MDECNNVQPACNSSSEFRNITGTCNNLKNPYWGAALTKLQRLLDPVYEDDKEIPVGGYSYLRSFPFRLVSVPHPNPRSVSSAFHLSTNVSSQGHTLMVMQFGQFLDHDIGLSPESNVEACCADPAKSKECFPIRVPDSDAFYADKNMAHRCLEFTRSVPFCKDKKMGDRREQFNLLTSFLDLSQVYGSDAETSSLLRTHSGGMLKAEFMSKNEMLPKISGKYKAGDIRAEEMPNLLAIHTLFMREHNRVARELQSLMNGATDEVIFQKARRVVIAEWQNIVYSEYLPVVLGPTFMAMYKLHLPTVKKSSTKLLTEEESTKYNPRVDPSIFNSFSTAAFRFGHSQIQGIVNMMSAEASGSVVKQFCLRNHFFKTGTYSEDEGDGMERLVSGTIGQAVQKVDRFVTAEVTNFLFLNKTKEADEKEVNGRGECRGESGDFGGDLVARNIQRGRDHGLPGYNKFRIRFGRRSIKSMAGGHRPSDITMANWNILRELYTDPDRMDLFAGGLAEQPAGGIVGATFSHIIGKQFRRLMKGDRFFFTHREQSGSFTAKQLRQLRRRTLRDIVCQNTRIAEARHSVFSSRGRPKACGRFHKLWLKNFA